MMMYFKIFATTQQIESAVDFALDSREPTISIVVFNGGFYCYPWFEQLYINKGGHYHLTAGWPLKLTEDDVELLKRVELSDVLEAYKRYPIMAYKDRNITIIKELSLIKAAIPVMLKLLSEGKTLVCPYT